MGQDNQFGPDTYTRHLAEETWREFACRAADSQELMSWQKAFRRRLREALGIPEIWERGRSDLNPDLESSEELEDCIRELWTIESEPGFRVPFYLMRPYGQEGPLPIVLAPHGHGSGHKPYVGIWDSEEEKKKAVEGERDIGIQAVKNGYVAIVPILRGYHRMSRQDWSFRSRPGVNSCTSQQMLALMFGRTLIGERGHDMSRMLDYARTRSDVQGDRVVVTGNSGGGTISLFAAALDTRISISIPSCYFCTFEASLGSVGHCECNFVPGIMRLGEMYDIAGLIAPRPFLAVCGEKDEIFPVDAVRYAFERVREIYEMAGCGEKCSLYVGSEGHRYYKKPVWPFVKKWI